MSRRTPAKWLVDADAAARELPPRAISLLRERTLRRWSVLGFAAFLLVLFGSQPAMAAPGCGDIPVVSGICSTITGTVSFASDPTGYIAGQIKGAVGSLLGEFAHLINATTSVDFSNTGFLQTYAIGFAVASVLTIILWLIAVAKRAVAGVGAVEAVAESIGLLVLSVAVTAFMPLATALIVSLVDDATNAALSPMLGNIGAIGNTVTSAWGPVAGLSGGNVLMSIIGVLMLVAAAGVWLELVIRSALIYLTLALGVMVFAGLVDKSLWRHTKRWIGVMAGVILSKYVTLTTLALATGLLANDNSSDVDTCLGIVLTALALFYLAMLAPVTLGRLIPVIGDDMVAAHGARAQAQGHIAGVPAQMNSAAEMVAGAGGSPGGDWSESESGEQDGGTGAQISGAKAQATGTAPASGGPDEGSGAQRSEADGAAQGASGEALPAEGAGAAAAGTAQSGAAQAGVAEEAAAAGGPIAAAAVAAEKIKETGEQAVSAAVERSSGGQIQQAPAAPSVSSAPGSAGSAASAEVPQQPPAPSAPPPNSPQQQAPPPQQSQPPPAAPQSARPPSPSQGPEAPPPSGPTPA